MINNNLQSFVGFGGMNSVGFGLGFGVILLLLLVWTFFWKGLALWHSAKKSQPVWFIIFLFLNTVGILEIIYLFGVLKLGIKDLFKK